MAHFARLACLFVVGAAATAVVAASPAAYSDHFSGGTGSQGCTGVNMADNATHTYFYDDLVAETSAAMTWSRNNNLDPTDINTQLDGSASAITDVLVYDRYYGDYCGYTWYTNQNSGYVGLVTCDGIVSVSNNRCEQHSLRVSNTWIDNTGTYYERSLACHENGHTLGLQHRPASVLTSCMPKDVYNTATYDTHDQSAINSNY